MLCRCIRSIVFLCVIISIVAIATPYSADAQSNKRTIQVKVLTMPGYEIGSSEQVHKDSTELSSYVLLEDIAKEYDNVVDDAYAYAFTSVVNSGRNRSIYNVKSADAERYVLHDNTEYDFADGDELWIYYYKKDFDLPVRWVKESGENLEELSDSEAMWWDDNEKEKDTVLVPSDHPIAVSSTEGAILWTPYTLPKKMDLADGMPLIRYEIRNGKLRSDPAYKEEQRRRAESGERIVPVKLLTSMEINDDVSTYYLQNSFQGIKVADNPDMEKAEIVTGNDMTLYVVYREKFKDSIIEEAQKINLIENKSTGRIIIEIIFVVGGVVLIVSIIISLLFRKK